MKRRLVLRPEAERDAVEIFQSLERQQQGLGRTFVVRLDAVVQRIEANPFLYAKFRGSDRAAQLRKFKYVVFYCVLRRSVDVFAVMHGSRSSSHWRSRLN